MKFNVPIALFVILIFALPALSQDWQRLEKASDDVKDAAAKLSDTTSDAFQKGRQNSSDTIEHAFLAEQVSAAARYMDKLVRDKYGIGDLRLSANVLSELADRFPSDGNSAWASLRDKIASLIFELGRDVGVYTGPVTGGEKTADSGEKVDESRILGRFFWNGEVDDELRLTIRGTTLSHRTVTGRTMPDGAYSFTAALPRENGLIVRVNLLDGRGNAVVIQQPNASNDYSTVIRIRDEDGGSKPHSLEIYWFKSGN